MRERGSSTARPTEKGVGGLLIRSIRSISARRFGRFGRFRSIRSSRFGVLLVSRFGRFGRVGRFRRVDSVDSVDFGASRRADSVDFVARPVDFGASRRDLQTSSWRFVPIRSIRSRRVASKSRRKHKKAQFLNRGIGRSYRKASRALNLRLIRLASKRASARSVLLGLARLYCSVTITSDLRHIVHYTLQNTRTHGRS